MPNNSTDQVPPRVLVNRVSEQAVFPSGLTLSTAKTIMVPNFAIIEVPTDLRFTVPFGVAFGIDPIPELRQKSISVSNGFIASGIDALVSVTIFNNSGSNLELKAGDQIAQLDTFGRMAPVFIDVTPRNGID